MSSGEARAPRRKARGRDEVQGTLEGLLGDEAADEEVADEEPEAKPAEEPEGTPRVRAARGDDPLRASLDALEESVKLLLARHEESVSALAAAEKRSRSRKGLDPVALQERVQELEAETERLERHATFLEDRIRGLLSRVRYVIES